MGAPSPERARWWARSGTGLVLAAAIGIIAAGVWWRSAPPADDSPEAGFARDMATHHAQAVEMAFVIRDKSSDQELRALAYDIIVTQSAQRGVFMGWLQAWGLPQASRRPRMAWMPGHAHLTAGSNGAPLMHGMASDDELRRLRMERGTAAEVLFLELMIRHHDGGIVMARALRPLSRRADVRRVTVSIEDSQAAEIAQMKQMLAARMRGVKETRTTEASDRLPL